MKTTINGRLYDTKADEELAATESANEYHRLFRTAEGDFYLDLENVWLDGRKLREDEFLPELAPWFDRDLEQRKRRVRLERNIVPVTPRDALVWCVKTQIPLCLRGYVLESI